MRVLFYNDWHFGDVHMSRNYIKDMISIFGDNDYYYYNKNNPFILSDIPNLKHNSSKEGFDLSINTWIGQYQSSVKFQGCNFIHYYDIMKRVYTELNIIQQIKNINQYIPEIDYSKFDLKSCNDFISNHEKIILVCNNDVRSGQSDNYDMSDLINEISIKFIDFDIIVSNYNTRVSRKNNIYFASEIINSDGFDLNEISYLSTKSSLILGRSSGPYSFSIVKENFTRSVPFVCLTNKEYDSWYLDENSNITWTNNYSNTNILNILEKKLYNNYESQLLRSI